MYRDGSRERGEGGAVVEHLGEQDQVESADDGAGRDVGRHDVDRADTARRRARLHERQRGARTIDEGHRARRGARP